ncbi:hypothetical protein EX30DRAFT_122968 [Ascodesmis nigricans]|uniref:Uncharacterized protein n=1 Tax=Ascodesmis nigricans TaxID=341454 RepID=A0A4S2MPH1_9PEZI|nr:hypothetical protein EX30DRAFT_122968 [Ascodesmis nigricans]
MDLTSLSSTLPRNASVGKEDLDNQEPVAAIRSAFTHAACSVTNLLRTASEQTERSRKIGRAEGYSECLEDLLALLSRIEHRSEPKTTETVRQWALSRKRKAGISQSHNREARERREDSMDSDIMTDAPQGSSPPPQEHPREPSPPVAERTRLPPTPPLLPPQSQFFNFRPEHNISMPSAAPETVSLDLMDADVSPPGSPARGPQHSFQPTAIFRGTHGHSNSGRGRHHWNHQQPRTGNKRRYSTMTEFLDATGIPLEKLQSMGVAKKSRYQ